MSVIVPYSLLHMQEQTELCSLEVEGKKQILCSDWANAQTEQRISHLGPPAFVASG